ncbi:hypothetical protein [Acidianus bottle-shaped virus 2 strain ABV2]|uniref:Uncharacterized protein n=1 Tax=Acidianus bottle-shaped virus 2 strain ABV2 TaxID=1732173 RepID=A0A0N9P954_9VIRU|nr:hypothetical protein AVU01_gp30 [Acidianus bottle-shaped virus 2 strain ABV2]ALG96778.1 hypothetical protein [Acidianus bottle-shaped virus 2 strain ABV2]
MEPIHFKCDKIINVFYPKFILCLDDYPGAGYAFTRPPLEVMVSNECPEGWDKYTMYFSPYLLCAKIIHRPVILTYKRGNKFYETRLEQ